eukprot:m.747136 g.747136  ORF g.747136 m.747136 type:complete len:368 (+) comp58961_c0_seq15:320-1423(+)
MPLIRIVHETGHITTAERDVLLKTKSTFDKTKTLQDRESSINTRCAHFNPNPALRVDRNLINEYGLVQKQGEMQARLTDQGVPWNEIEIRVWEIQEYRNFCPLLENAPLNVNAHDSENVYNNFHLFLYPKPDEGATRATIFDLIRDIIRRSPYATLDPRRASLFIPNVDTSCWCESCMFRGFDNIIDIMHPNSIALGEQLAALEFWNGGRNHILFELSDAACMPYNIGLAIGAKSGLSEFHFRSGLDISMPLFGMVEFSAQQRQTPPHKRRFLLTFRGTRSERSDAMRNELHRIHNGADIVLLVACRWFGQNYFRDYLVEDTTCAGQEDSFQQYTFTELSVRLHPSLQRSANFGNRARPFSLAVHST